MSQRAPGNRHRAGTTSPVKEIRAITRAIEVMNELCRAGACSLADLHRATGLSKSTLRRILLTLENGGFVRCTLADGRYRANVHVPSLEVADVSPALARVLVAARPVLEELADEVVWPSDLTVRDGIGLRIVESNRRIIPLRVSRNEIGDRVDMVSTAAGRAYLALCSERERAELMAEISAAAGTRAVRELERVLPSVRARGWAERSSAHTGNTERHPHRNDKLSAVAMPIMYRRRVVCCMNMLWPRGITTKLGGAAEMAHMLATFVRKIEDSLIKSTHDKTASSRL